ncbi:MAG: PAS domain-containing protein [Psychroflexus sp.]
MKDNHYLKKELYELIKTDESIFDFIQEAQLDGIWYWDLENPDEEWISPKFWKILGYNPDEMPHKIYAWQNLINQDDLKIAMEKVKQHCENPSIPYEQTIRYTHKNGSTVWIYARGKAIHDKNGKAVRVLGAHIDITELKKNEQELIKYNTILKESEELTDTGSFEYLIPENKFTTSDNWQKITGGNETMSKDEIMLISHPDDREKIENAFDNALKNIAAYNIKHRLIRPTDNEVRIVKARGKVIFDENGKPLKMHGSVMDITEREKTKEILIRTNTILEEAEKINKTGSWELDIETGQTIWSKEVYSIYEVEKEFDHNKENGIDFYHPDFKKVITDAISKSISEEISFDVSCKFISAKGNEKWVRSTGQPSFQDGKMTKLFGVITDITDQVLASEKLEKLNEMQSLLMKSASTYINVPLNSVDATINNSLKEIGEFVSADRVYVFSFDWEKDTCSNTYEWCNNNIESQIKNLQNLTNDSISIIVEAHKDGVEVYIEDIMQLPAGDNLRKILETQEIKSILTVPMMLERKCIGFIGFDYVRSTYMFTDQDKKLLNIFGGMIANLNSRKLVEKHLIEAKEDAQRADKAKSEFLANMSHEIRTPMNSVIGFSELLKSTQLNEIQEQYVDTIHDSGLGLLNIINDILDFSKIEAGKLDIEVIETDIIDLVDQTAGLVKHLALNKDIELKISIDSKIPRFALLDPTRVRQILTNLLSNALKFTEKGKVELKLSLLARKGGFGQIQFSVCDTGIGISDAQKAKLFKAFSQADSSTTRKFGGTGLGLVISDQLVRKMGGKLDVKSKEGEGSEFYFTLETELRNIEIKRPNILSEKIKSKAKSDFINYSTFKVLIVDDNLNNMLLASSLIKRVLPNVELFKAENGKVALEKIISLKPDLIFMDVQMPEMDGNETTSKLREYESKKKIKRTIVIGLTAGASINKKDKALNSGMDDFLTKPIETNKLESILNKYLINGSRQVNTESENELLFKDLNHFDRKELLYQLGGDIETLEFLIPNAIEDVEKKLSDLEIELNKSDLKKAESIAHSLKGTSLNLRWGIFSEILITIEKEIISKNKEAYFTLFQELKQEWDILLGILKKRA